MKNLLFLILYIIIIVWTSYCIQEMWAGSRVGIPYGADGNHLGNLPSDLPKSLTYIIIELMLFFSFLRPETYNLTKSIFRCAALLPFFLGFGAIHILDLWHAGTVNGIMMMWWVGMIGIVVGLIVIGIILRIKNK